MNGVSGAADPPERFVMLQQLLGTALDRLGAGAYAVDADGGIIAVNAQAEVLLGRGADELLGRDAHDCLHRRQDGMTMPRSQCPMMEAFMADQVRQEEKGFFARGDGSLLTASWLVAPLRITSDERGALVVFHEYSQAGAPLPVSTLRAGLLSELERLALLAETTTRLTATLDVGEALDRLVQLIVPMLADWVVIDLLTENGQVQRTLVSHGDDRGITRRHDLQGALLSVPETSPLPLSRALRGAGSTLATPQTYQGPPDSDVAVEQRRLFEATGMHSALIAPVRGLREVLGALTLGRSDQAEPFTTAEIPLLEDITRRAGLALDNARLYQRQRKVAETMQRHLLPQLPRVPGLDMTARYLPAPHASQVGGDWYDVFHLSDRALALVIGDVAGHDLDAAAGMAQVRNILRAYAWSRREPLSALVERFDQALPHITDVGMATMILGRLQPGTAGSGSCGGPTRAIRRPCWSPTTAGPAISTADTASCSAPTRVSPGPTPSARCRRCRRWCSTPTGSSNPPGTPSTTAWSGCAARRPPRRPSAGRLHRRPDGSTPDRQRRRRGHPDRARARGRRGPGLLLSAAGARRPFRHVPELVQVVGGQGRVQVGEGSQVFQKALRVVLDPERDPALRVAEAVEGDHARVVDALRGAPGDALAGGDLREFGHEALVRAGQGELPGERPRVDALHVLDVAQESRPALHVFPECPGHGGRRVDVDGF